MPDTTAPADVTEDQPSGRVSGVPLRLSPMAVAVLVAGLLANALLLLHYSDGIYFWADEWDLLFRRGTIPSEDVGLLEPHSGHLMAAPILVYRALLAVFGLGSYTPWAVTQIGLHMTICVLIALVVRRVGASSAAAVGAALAVAWWGIGANGQLWAVGMNHSGPLLLGLVVCLLVAGPAPDRRAAWVGAVLLCIGVTFSLTVVAASVMVAVLAWHRRGLAFAARVVVPPAVLLGLWFVQYGRHGLDEINGSVAEQNRELTRIPGRVWEGLALTFDAGSGLPGIGAVLVLGVVVALLVARDVPASLVAMAAAGLVAAVVQLSLTAYGRYNDGVELLGSAVYTYITVVLMAPALALAGQVAFRAIRGPRWVGAAVVAVLASTYLMHSWAELRAWHASISLVSRGNYDLMLGMVAAADAGARPLDRNHPEALSPYLLPEYVLTPQIRAALPDETATPVARLSAEATFFVGVGPDGYDLPPVDHAMVSGLEPAEAGDGTVGDCRTYTATSDAPVVSIDSEEGAEVTVTSDSATISTTLSRDGVSGPAREWAVQPGTTTHVATSAVGASMTLTFSAGGTYTVCRPATAG